MNVLVTGGTGFIGQALVPALLAADHDVFVLSRSAASDTIPGARIITSLESLDVDIHGVINLAGASLAGRRWSDAYKQEIVRSRIDTTADLGEFFSRRDERPEVWLNASAIGFYGPHGSEPLDETADAGTCFSSQLCTDWEAAALAAAGGDARLCVLRLGVVLDRVGGAYEQMAQPFRIGIANWIGDGRQYLSWIHRDDVIKAMLALLADSQAHGPYNLTAPTPVTSREFCVAMRRVHTSLPGLPMPGWLMRLMVGEMADELLITGQRVIPQRLLDAGFGFDYPTIDAALDAIENS